MTISNFRKHLISSLVIASATFSALTAGAAAANLSGSDPQEQARQLLAPAGARSVAPSGSLSVPSRVAVRAIDPQELARRLLAGADGYRDATMAVPAIRTVRAERNGSLDDGQALAQHMILGVRRPAKTHAVTTAAAHSQNTLE